MLKTIIVLPDGTELSSGVTGTNAVQSVTITEMVNDSLELTLGSTCANMLEAKLITPEGGLPIAKGDELTVYREDLDGVRHKVGLFTTEKPTRPSANTMTVTAYDRVSWLDKDLTLWLDALDAWPYALHAFTQMVCQACGLTLANEEIPNGDYYVRAFSADGITGRQLIRWVGQIAGRFCRATADGEIEFAWYTPITTHDVGITDKRPTKRSEDAIVTDDGNGNITINANSVNVVDDGQGNVTISSDQVEVYDDGNGNVFLTITNRLDTLFYYMNSLTFEDYVVAPIEKVQLRQNEEDVGTVYPDTAEALNTYIITGNYLLTASSGDELVPVAQTIYEGLQGVTYTPCKVSVPANMHIRAGHIVHIIDKNGKKITAYVMTKTTSGQKDTLECTGSATRVSSTAVNNQTFKAIAGKVLNLRTDVDGLKVENKGTAGNVASLSLEIEGIEAQVKKQQQETEGIRQDYTNVSQTAENVAILVQSILDNGTDKIKTGMGYTFDDEGMHIKRSGEELSTLIDHTGMQVSRSKENVLQATAEGVKAIDITVKNYLVVGDYARFEDYTDGKNKKRTACFHLGG